MSYEPVSEGLSTFAPVTNHYRLDDGRYVLVTVPDDVLPVPAGLAMLSAVKVDQVLQGRTEVFLADENGTVIDADGDPANGMTPLAVFPPGTTHVDALAAFLGDAEV